MQVVAALVVLLFSALVACGTTEPPATHEDGGLAIDSGLLAEDGGAPAEDGGATQDGGSIADGGSRPDGGSRADGGALDAGVSDAGATADGGARCPPEMALSGSACVDRWEATTVEILDGGGERPHSPYYPVDGLVVRAVSAPGVAPQGYISYTQARVACSRAGKRLCSASEWLRACRGSSASNVYPYGGTTRVAGACNDGRTQHPVIQLFDAGTGVFDSVHMNDPRINQQADTLTPTGALAGCRGPDGTFDMVGNLQEWIEDPAGTFKGKFYVYNAANGPGCNNTTTAHAGSYHDYSTGFRCCMTPGP